MPQKKGIIKRKNLGSKKINEKYKNEKKSFFWHFKNFFVLLWNVHILHRCPVCKNRIIETDYPKELVQEAKCSNTECKWGWK